MKQAGGADARNRRRKQLFFPREKWTTRNVYRNKSPFWRIFWLEAPTTNNAGEIVSRQWRCNQRETYKFLISYAGCLITDRTKMEKKINQIECNGDRNFYSRLRMPVLWIFWIDIFRGSRRGKAYKTFNFWFQRARIDWKYELFYTGWRWSIIL